MSNTPARVPYFRLQVANLSDTDREFQKISRNLAGLFVPTLVSAATYTVKATDWLILVDATAAPITVTFPAAARVDGQHVTVIKVDAGANAVTLAATISGVASPTLAAQYKSMTVDAGNGTWYKTAST